MDPRQDFNLLVVLVMICAAAVASVVTTSANYPAIRGLVFSGSLAASVLYYIAVIELAR